MGKRVREVFLGHWSSRGGGGEMEEAGSRAQHASHGGHDLACGRFGEMEWLRLGKGGAEDVGAWSARWLDPRW